MANQARLGFIPCGGTRGGPRRYTVASAFTLANSQVGIAPGEVVKAVSDGTITVQQVGDTTVLGVVASVRYKNTDGTTVYNGVLPAGYTYTGDADVLNPNAPIIEVWDHPDNEYIAAMAVSSGTPLTEFQKQFSNMELTATSSTSVDSIYKRSLRALSGTAAATATLPFRFIEIVRSPSQDYSATSNLRVRVAINAGFHPFYNPTAI